MLPVQTKQMRNTGPAPSTADMRLLWRTGVTPTTVECNGIDTPTLCVSRDACGCASIHSGGRAPSGWTGSARDSQHRIRPGVPEREECP